VLSSLAAEKEYSHWALGASPRPIAQLKITPRKAGCRDSDHCELTRKRSRRRSLTQPLDICKSWEGSLQGQSPDIDRSLSRSRTGVKGVFEALRTWQICCKKESSYGAGGLTTGMGTELKTREKGRSWRAASPPLARPIASTRQHFSVFIAFKTQTPFTCAPRLSQFDWYRGLRGKSATLSDRLALDSFADTFGINLMPLVALRQIVRLLQRQPMVRRRRVCSLIRSTNPGRQITRQVFMTVAGRQGHAILLRWN